MTPFATTRTRRLSPSLWLFALLAALCLCRPAAAQTAQEACGQRLSPPVFAKWTQMGGAEGALGCPEAPQSPDITSPQGDKAQEADFPRGMILWHVTGPRAGQTYAMTGCIWRLYFQYGGPSGWLGLPTGDPENTPDGQFQTFEGGRIVFERALNDCTAERTPAAAAAAPPPASVATSPLDLFFDASRDDHLSAASAVTVQRALAANYQRIEGQARVFDQAVPASARLKLFWNADLGDHMTVATADGSRDALSRGYEFEGSEGFVWTDPHPGAVPLKLYRKGDHHWLTATPAEDAQALARGFTFVRIEGYAPAA